MSEEEDSTRVHIYLFILRTTTCEFTKFSCKAAVTIDCCCGDALSSESTTVSG